MSNGPSRKRNKHAPRTTREAILEAATELFSLRGFEGVTTREIAKAVGIASPSIYKHFGSVDEIISEALAAVTRCRVADYAHVLGCNLPPREKLKAIAIALMTAFLENSTLVALYQQVMMPRAARISEMTSALWDEEIYPQFLKIVHEVDGEVDPGFTYYILFSFCLGAAAYMPPQDRRRPLTAIQRSPRVLAERGLSAALPNIDWTKVSSTAVDKRR